MTETATQRPFSAASFDQYLAEHKLMAAHCASCGTMHLPPRAICPECHSDQMEWVETSGKGKLAAFTVIYVAPNAMIAQGFGREKPYITGIVEIEEGAKISARIIGFDAAKPETIKIGADMAAEFIEFGEGDAKKTFLAFRAV